MRRLAGVLPITKWSSVRGSRSFSMNLAKQNNNEASYMVFPNYYFHLLKLGKHYSMKALLLVAILLKDLIIKQCFFKYMCCKALNGR
jgi:hypothetical protein